MNEKVIINSNYKVVISESQELDCLNVKFIICDFYTNKNGFKLNRDTIETWLDTLLFKPLVGKIDTNKDGDEDFTSHQAKKVYKLENGKISQTYKFGTDAFGTFSEVQIEEIDGVEYIVANAKVWKRFEQACQIIQEKFDNNEPQTTSWEISILDSNEVIENGKKTVVINNGVFIGHSLLSKYISPAYDCSLMLEVAEEDEENKLANAIVDDLNNLIEKEVLSYQSEQVSVEDIKESTLKGGIKNMEDENKVVVSALTTSDIRNKVASAIYSTEGNNRYYYGVMVYPFDFVAYAKLEGKGANEEDYTKFTYVVNSDQTISITAQEDMVMIFVPKEQNDQIVAELEEKIANAETSLSEKTDEIIKLGETIKSQESVIAEKEIAIAELQPFKVQADEITAEKEKVELSEKQEALKGIVISSKYFTEEEIEASEEMKKAISELDEKSVKEMIAEKVILKASEIKVEEVVVTSEKAEVVISTDLNAEKEYNYSKSGNTLLDYLNKKSKK